MILQETRDRVASCRPKEPIGEAKNTNVYYDDSFRIPKSGIWQGNDEGACNQYQS